jgi:DNA-binding SARP family transcriptional activator/tetratricopeptide (TPR) repeat protein
MPPFSLTTLGAVDLRHAQRGQITTLLAQPKRLALLVYLLVEFPGAFARRDQLLALFWPEADESRARASLRQSLQFLRRALGEDAVLSRGDDEVGIATDVIAVDVLDFRSAAQQGRLADALARYRGPLLPGFLIDDTPAFEQWLSQERERLRRSAVRMAGEMASAAPDGETARTFAEMAVALAPEDEPATRRLVALYQQAGDHGAARMALDRLRAWLAGELGVEPSSETTALERALQVSLSAAPPPLPTIAPSLPAAPAPATTVPPAPRRHRKVLVPVAAAILIALVALVGQRIRVAQSRAPSAHQSASLPRIVVLPFDDRTASPQFSEVGRMVADWITAGLSTVDGIAVVPLTAVSTSVQALTPPGATTSTDSVRTLVARDVGASVLVRGVAYRTNDTLHLQAYMSDVVTGALVRPSVTVSVPGDQIMAGIDRLRERVVAALTPLGDTVSHLRRATPPPSYEAYRDYVRGLETFVSGDAAGALQQFERAASADTLYAMPRIAASIMLLNLGRFDEAERMIRRVDPMRTPLGPYERANYDMVRGMMRGDLAAVDLAVREQARIAPGTISEYMVAETARRRGRPGDALRVLRALGPDRGELRGWRPYWRELTAALHMQRAYVEEVAAARAALARYGDAPSLLGYLVRALAALGDIQAIELAVAQREALASPAFPDAGALLFLAAKGVEARGDRPTAQMLRARELAWYAARPADGRTTGQRVRHARALLLTGATSAARDTLTVLHRVDSTDVDVIGMLAAAAARAGDTVEVSRLQSRLDALQRARTPVTRALSDGDVPYWLAVIHAQRGDSTAAVSQLQHAYANGRGRDPSLESDPWFARIRGSRSFQALLNFPQ